MRLKSLGLTLILALFSLFVVGCSINASRVIIDETIILLQEDFSGDIVGESPSQWSVGNPESRDPDTQEARVAGSVTVVEDDGVPSGRAVLIKTHLIDPAKNVSITRFFDENTPSFANTIEVKHSFKWVEGSGMNIYILGPKGSSWIVNWFVDNGEVGYRGRNDDDTQNVNFPNIAQLNPGWNTIRVVADRAANKAMIYVNDVEALDTPQNFRGKTDTWVDSRLQISLLGNSSRLSEALVSDIKVTVVD